MDTEKGKNSYYCQIRLAEPASVVHVHADAKPQVLNIMDRRSQSFFLYYSPTAKSEEELRICVLDNESIIKYLYYHVHVNAYNG